jgi:hypothetical protein
MDLNYQSLKNSSSMPIRAFDTILSIEIEPSIHTI